MVEEIAVKSKHDSKYLSMLKILYLYVCILSIRNSVEDAAVNRRTCVYILYMHLSKYYDPCPSPTAGTWDILTTPGFTALHGPEKIYKSEAKHAHTTNEKFDKAVRL